jgi:hypothetical protein
MHPMWKRISALARDFWLDTSGPRGLIAPFISVLVSAIKYFEWPMRNVLEEVSYAWALLPIVAWLLIAYVRRRHAHRALIDEYAGAVHLEKINHAPNHIMLHLRNTTDKVLIYTVESLRIQTTHHSFLQNRWMIARGSPTEFGAAYAGTMPSPPFDLRIELALVYGPLGGGFTRRMQKRFRLHVTATETKPWWDFEDDAAIA